MKVSVITDVLNSKDTIEDAMRSVLSQTHKEIEYILVDGASCDGTMEIVNKYRDKIAKFISEPDNGHFEAMNKGIRLATGDIVGFLHADDFFADDKVIKKVADVFSKRNIDCLWGDLVYVGKENTARIIRYWKSCAYRKNLFSTGWMPPHPTFFVKRWVYEKYGYFNTELKIASDYEIMLRFLHKHDIAAYYMPEVLVKMRIGGLSNRSLGGIIKKTKEDFRAWKLNGLSRRPHTIVMKNISKVPQFFVR